MTTLNMPYWADLHAHFRQGPIVPPLIEQHAAMGCRVILAMPNTKPPVGRVLDNGEGSDLNYWSIEAYRDFLLRNGAEVFDEVIVPLYITRDTTPRMITEGAKRGVLRAAKYYPPHGTTNSDHGIPMDDLLRGDVLRALADNNVVLCIHGEQHGVSGEAWFGRDGNAEATFYREVMPRVIDHCDHLRIVGEHITTAKAVRLITAAPERVAATITPQHLKYVVGDLAQAMKLHLYCMPLVKFAADVDALRFAVTDPRNRKFFAGTDSAPHPKLAKLTDCGCAAGCYTGGIAPQLYAAAFEDTGFNLLDNPDDAEAFYRFMAWNGPDFYGIPRSGRTFKLVKEPSTIGPLAVPGGEVVPLPVGLLPDSPDRVATLPWRVELD